MSVVGRRPVRRTKVEYGSAPSQFGHLYVPSEGLGAAAPARLVVLVHGGSWSVEFGSTTQTAIARMLAERGAAVWNIEYRRIGNGGGWPETLLDVAAAVGAAPPEWQLLQVGIPLRPE